MCEFKEGDKVRLFNTAEEGFVVCTYSNRPNDVGVEFENGEFVCYPKWMFERVNS